MNQNMSLERLYNSYIETVRFWKGIVVLGSIVGFLLGALVATMFLSK